MHTLQYLNNTIWKFKYSTNAKYKIKYLILKQHYYLHTTDTIVQLWQWTGLVVKMFGYYYPVTYVVKYIY